MGVSPFGFAPFSLSGYGCGVADFVTSLDTFLFLPTYCFCFRNLLSNMLVENSANQIADRFLISLRFNLQRFQR